MVHGGAVIRELAGLMTAVRADEGIIVTAGKFTGDARESAAGKPIRLIDGPELLALVRTAPEGEAAGAPRSAGGTTGGSGADPGRRGGA